MTYKKRKWLGWFLVDLFREEVEREKIHWVRWEMLCLTTKEGGLGCKFLHSMSEALLAKWSSRYGEEKEHLWCRAISEKYGEGDSWWEPRGPNGPFGTSL